ncbi:MAG: right-handed parallel beta-helix repeat-containing protein [Pseudomonadota bacterium]
MQTENILKEATITVVSPTESISAAIKKAKAGSRILIKAGVYQEELIIDKPLEIISEGKVVVESKNSYCISMKTDHALVRGLSLHNRAERYFAVDIPQGKLSLEYCDITSDSLACVGIHGDEAVGILSHCQIYDSKKGSGVFVCKQGTGQIENCDIFGNTEAGIEIREGSNPIVKDCRIYNGKANGIMVWEKGFGQIKDCDIFGNALSGINIKTGGNPVVKDCKIHESKQVGVYVYEQGTGQIENCDIFGNARAGIAIKTGGNPVIKKCTIKQNGYQAVWVYKGGAGTIQDSDLRNNAKGAWNIEYGCQVRRCGNKE